MRRVFILALLAAAAAFLVGSSRSAPPPDPYIQADPDPVAAYGSYILTGCNYKSGISVQVQIDRGFAFPTQEIGSSGCLEPIQWYATDRNQLIEANKEPACGSGAYGHSAGAKCGVLASTVLEVQP